MIPASMPLPYCVYILFSQKDHLLYTGFTTHLDQRIRNHNDGKTTSTSPRRPLILIFCEYYLFEEDARKREMYFKTTAGKKAVKLMLGRTLVRLGYGATVIVESVERSPDEIDPRSTMNPVPEGV